MRVQSRESVNSERTIPFDIWETSGTTEHLGGIFATQRLLDMCHIAPGQTVLDLGCGTGYTACYLAQKYQARVVAVDLSPGNLEQAQERVSRQGPDLQVTLLQADAHHLPCNINTFDAVIVESVLVFCDAAQVALEIHRVLKPGGVFGVNELSLLKPSPEELHTLLVDTLGIQTYQEVEWQSIFKRAGFVDVSSTVRRFSLREQLASHIKVDGIRGYLSAMAKGLADLKISRTFINRRMLQAARQFLPFVGYGIYTGRKDVET